MDPDSSRDIPAVLARARAAQHRAAVLIDLAGEAAIQAMLMCHHVEAVRFPPVVEATLHLLLGRDGTGTPGPPEHPVTWPESTTTTAGGESPVPDTEAAPG